LSKCHTYAKSAKNKSTSPDAWIAEKKTTEGLISSLIQSKESNSLVSFTVERGFV
jgi:hypothetical protein